MSQFDLALVANLFGQPDDPSCFVVSYAVLGYLAAARWAGMVLVEQTCA